MRMEFAAESSREAALIQVLQQWHVTQMENNMQFSLYWFPSRIWESLQVDYRTKDSQPACAVVKGMSWRGKKLAENYSNKYQFHFKDEISIHSRIKTKSKT